jgi:uncharacterized protein
MELVNEFVVNKSVDETWPILTDLERIAPCMPGAQLTEVEGDIYRGLVKIKVGPIGASFNGQASFVERDDANHRAVLKADGRDSKGNGNASALITATLEAVTATTARCRVTTDLNITGKIAQFGRSALPDISGRLITQFADNLNAMIDTPAAASAGGSATGTTSTGQAVAGAAAPAGEAVSPNGAAPAATTAETPAPPAAADDATTALIGAAATSSTADPSRPTVRKINSNPVEPLNVGSVLPSWVKTVVPAVLVAVILFCLLRRKR